MISPNEELFDSNQGLTVASAILAVFFGSNPGIPIAHSKIQTTFHCKQESSVNNFYTPPIPPPPISVLFTEFTISSFNLEKL